MTNAPVVTVVGIDEHETRYRVSGQPTSLLWDATRRPGVEAWCEIAIRHGSSYLARCGGEVFPTAWPELFELMPATAGYGSACVRVTDAGRTALASALHRPRIDP